MFSLISATRLLLPGNLAAGCGLCSFPISWGNSDCEILCMACPSDSKILRFAEINCEWRSVFLELLHVYFWGPLGLRFRAKRLGVGAVFL